MIPQADTFVKITGMAATLNFLLKITFKFYSYISLMAQWIENPPEMQRIQWPLVRQFQRR